MLMQFNPPIGGTNALLNIGHWTHKIYDPNRVLNHPAAGNPGAASWLTVERHLPGVPEPGR
jgi:hypothetical protein